MSPAVVQEISPDLSARITQVASANIKFLLTLPKWQETMLESMKFHRRDLSYADQIQFDNADPGFEPFEPIPRTISTIVQTKGEVIRRYTGPNQTYRVSETLVNAEMIAPYFSRLGLKPCSQTKKISQRDTFIIENFLPGLGATHLYHVALDTFLKNATDVLLVSTPTYGLFGAKKFSQTVTIPAKESNGWVISDSDLEATIQLIKSQGRTPKMFLNINPHNPLGIVVGKEAIAKIAMVLKRHQIIVIDDMVYGGLELVDKKAFPIGAISGMEDSTISLFSASKAFGAAGLRAGLAVGPYELITAMAGHVTDQFESVPLTTWGAIIGAFASVPQVDKLRNEYLRSNAAEYSYRLELVHALIRGDKGSSINVQQALRKFIIEMGRNGEIDLPAAISLYRKGIEGLKAVNRPDAGYFQLLDFSHFKGWRTPRGEIITSGCDMALYIAKNSGVRILPGELMQYEGERLIGRISYALPPKDIVRGLIGIQQCLLRLSAP